MSERLTFDQKINGLAEYYEQLLAIDPSHNHDVKPPTYSSSHIIANGLREACESLMFSVGCHARAEWQARGYSHSDLRVDTDEMRTERVGILSMMSVPGSPESFYDRAAQIAALLGKVIAGDLFKATRWHDRNLLVRTEHDFQADPELGLYTEFDSHISHRVLRIDQGNQKGNMFGVREEQPINVLRIDLEQLSRSNAQASESVA